MAPRLIAQEPTTATAAAAETADVKGTRTVTNIYGKRELRPVVYTLDACLRHEGDFYHPEFGWLRAGGKKEVDLPDPADPQGGPRVGRIFGED